MGLNIDELLPEEESQDKITSQVEAIQRSHGKRFPSNYSLSWVLANQVVQRYYGRLGLDAIPLWRDNFGWSQFSISRSTSCHQAPNRGEESLRYIMFDAISVNWKNQGQEGGNQGRGTQFDLHNAIWIRNESASKAVKEALDFLDLEDSEPFNHSACLHGPHAYAYTKLFQVVTDLICRAPEMVGRRELTIDLDAFGSPYDEVVHPLRKAKLVPPGVTREWFELNHTSTQTRLFINVFTGDILYIGSDETWKLLDYPGWNERNEEQLTAYFAEMLGIPQQ